jgi:glycosyltransferase involved in cell wall biosynthesis
MMPPVVRVLELRSVRGTGGGPEKTILFGAARTDTRRFAVTVCYLRDARDTVFKIDAVADGLPVDYVEVLERHSFDSTVLPKLRALVRERRIDIVHSHEYKTDVLAWLLARCERVTALATVHGWTGHTSRERFVYYPLDRWLLRFFPKLIAVSENIRQTLVADGARPDRIVRVLNGIDHRAFVRDRSRAATVRASLALGADDVIVGSVGRLEPQKRLDLLIEAVAKLRPKHPTLKLLVVGDGSSRQQLASQIERLGLGDTCRLMGHRTDIVELHHAFDLFVQSSDYEGTPNAVLEAMAMETPVVATDVGGTAELIRDQIDGLIVPAGDVSRLSQAIENALGDAAATTARTAAARRRVETDLSFDARMAAVEAIYEELHASRSPAHDAHALAART